MRSPLNRLARFAALSLVAGGGCALTSKSDPVEFRYFTPEASTRTADASQSGDGHSGKGLEVRLGRVNSSSYIHDKIAFRDETHELGYYEELRWTEKPELYLKRAVSRALFEAGGVTELVSRPGPTLEIELDTFDEVRAPRHVARVQITWSLRDEDTVHLQKTLTIERPIKATSAEKLADAIAGAMADALGEAVTTIVDGTVAALAGGRATGVSAAEK